MITIKSDREIELIRASGRILAAAHKAISESVRVGITTKELDKIAEKTIIDLGGIPAFKGYNGFPATICSSVNEEVVHGIPGSRVLHDGDIISVDIGVILNGYYSDAARTHLVGNVSEEVKALVKHTRLAFEEGLKQCVVGNRISDIGHAVQSYAEALGYGVVRDLCGHGVGTSLHEEPEIPNFGSPGKGPRLRAGMVIAVEPMINLGTYEVRTLDDGWTVVTADGKPSAHHENTIAILDDGPVLLTSFTEV